MDNSIPAHIYDVAADHIFRIIVIDIAVKINPEGRDYRVPLFHMLNFVKKEIYFSIRLLCPFRDVLIEVICILQLFKMPGLKINLYDIFLWHSTSFVDFVIIIPYTFIIINLLSAYTKTITRPFPDFPAARTARLWGRPRTHS